MKYRCKNCGYLQMESGFGMLCDKCGGNEFESTPEFQQSRDSNVYTDERIGDNG